MKDKISEAVAANIGGWTAPEITGDIPHGDMPGDKVEVNESHIRKSRIIFPKLLPLLADAVKANPAGRAVVSVYGGSGVGKSETASLITYYLNEIGVGGYTLSGDNYPRRIPAQNDAERVRIYRTCGVRGMIDAGVYSKETAGKLAELWDSERDADPKEAEENRFLEVYQSAGRAGLAGYLGTENEQNFDEINDIIARFKAGEDRIWLKRMGRTETALWYDEIDFSGTGVLVIEWTHGNNAKLRGIDVPVFLNSTPEETREHRRMRNRDGKVDSAFTTTVLEIEQALLASQAESAKLIVAKNGDILDYPGYLKLMEADGR